jgi:hypothetical protein
MCGLWVSLRLPCLGWLTRWREERSGLKTPRPLFSRYQRVRLSVERPAGQKNQDQTNPYASADHDGDAIVTRFVTPSGQPPFPPLP